MIERTKVLAAVVSVLGLAAMAGAPKASAATIIDQIGINVGGPSGALTYILPSKYPGFIRDDHTWTHTYSVLGTIIGASFEIDVIDADVGSLGLIGDGMTIGTADPAGNNSGGAPGPWRDVGDPLDPTFVFTLGPSFFPLLADGSFTVNASNNGMTWWGSNRAILTITTDYVAEGQVPEPGTLALFGLGLAGFGFMRRRRAA